MDGADLGRISLSSRLFEEKTAREKAYHYDGCPEHNGPAWRSDTFDYFVSKCPAAGPWLQWAERCGSTDCHGACTSQSHTNCTHCSCRSCRYLTPDCKLIRHTYRPHLALSLSSIA